MDACVHCIIMGKIGGSLVVIDLYRFVVVQAKGEMDGLERGYPALENGVLVFPRALFEQAKAYAVESELQARHFWGKCFAASCVGDHGGEPSKFCARMGTDVLTCMAARLSFWELRSDASGDLDGTLCCWHVLHAAEAFED